MVYINPTVSIIIINVNKLSTQKAENVNTGYKSKTHL